MRILVIVARGLHLGYLGCYGNGWIDTPALDSLAAEGIVFDRHFADQPTATGAGRAWRSGHHPFPPEGTIATPDLLDVLRSGSVVTVLLRDGQRPGLAEFAVGWDRVGCAQASAEEEAPLDGVRQALRTALADLARSERWLLWLELSTLLPPWQVPESFLTPYCEEAELEDEDEDEDTESEPLTPWTEPLPERIDPLDDVSFRRLQCTYAGVVRYLDEGLGLLLDELREDGLLDDLLVVFTSDHGLPLGEHGWVGSAPLPHEELIHLPLLMRLPGATEAGRRITELTQPVDLFPTLTDAFGLPTPPTHGRSLLPLLHGQEVSGRTYACALVQSEDTLTGALRSADWSFLVPLSPALEGQTQRRLLFVQPDDRWEVNNVHQHHLELADKLEQTLRGFIAAAGQPGPLQAPELPTEEPTEEGPESPPESESEKST